MAAAISGSILIFTFFGFWIFRKKLAGEPTITLDVDWLYRRPVQWARKFFLEGLEAVFDRVETLAVGAARRFLLLGKNPAALLPGSAAEKDFSPDRRRPALQRLILLALFSFVIFSVWKL